MVLIMTELFKSTSRFKNTDVIVFKGHTLPALMKRFDFLYKSKLADGDIIKIEIKVRIIFIVAF